MPTSSSAAQREAASSRDPHTDENTIAPTAAEADQTSNLTRDRQVFAKANSVTAVKISQDEYLSHCPSVTRLSSQASPYHLFTKDGIPFTEVWSPSWTYTKNHYLFPRFVMKPDYQTQESLTVYEVTDAKTSPGPAPGGCKGGSDTRRGHQRCGQYCRGRRQGESAAGKENIKPVGNLESFFLNPEAPESDMKFIILHRPDDSVTPCSCKMSTQTQVCAAKPPATRASTSTCITQYYRANHDTSLQALLMLLSIVLLSLSITSRPRQP